MNSVVKKVALKTIGCKVNQYETGTLRQSFSSNGYQIVEFGEYADFYIINTCAVTAEAERKSKQMIRKAARINPAATIIVTGCAVESNLDDIREFKDISFIAGNSFKENIYPIINQIPSTEKFPAIFTSPIEQIRQYKESTCYSTSNRIRGIVKIQDGCNQFCSYCIIPYLRGRARSRPVKQILSEINTLADKGYQEVVLLGINLGSYGNDLDDSQISLFDLIRKIENIAAIKRIRLSSIELPYVNKELINAFAYFPKLCHHLHIPLQSGDNRVLKLMNRKYTTEQYYKTVMDIKEQVPDIAITTDVITGFPGEDVNAFENTLDLAGKISFARIHGFPYSERKFNLASFLPAENEEIISKNRSREIIKLSKELHKKFIFKNRGREGHVLIEYQGQKENTNFVCGLTDNYIKVYINNTSTPKGQMIKVKIVDDKEGYAIGEPV